MPARPPDWPVYQRTPASRQAQSRQSPSTHQPVFRRICVAVPEHSRQFTCACPPVCQRESARPPAHACQFQSLTAGMPASAAAHVRRHARAHSPGHRRPAATLPVHNLPLLRQHSRQLHGHTAARLPGCPPVSQPTASSTSAHAPQSSSAHPSRYERPTITPCLPDHSRLSTSAPCSLPRHSLSRSPASLRANGCLCKNAQPRVCERIRQPTNTYPSGLQPIRTAASLPGHTHQSTSTQVPAGQRAVPVPACASQTSSAQALLYQQTRMRAHE
jgi:hypothetical protein